jgi:hypothetical protein
MALPVFRQYAGNERRPRRAGTGVEVSLTIGTSWASAGVWWLSLQVI